MSKLSLYETKWTDLVFENKNKEYGAYQLRQESAKTSFSALLLGLLLIATLVSISLLINKFQTPVVAETPTVIDEPVIAVHLDNRPRAIEKETTKPITPPKQNVTTTSDTKQLVNPVVVVSDQAIQNIATNTDNAPVVDNTPAGTGSDINALPTDAMGGNSGLPTDIITDPVSTTALDKLPEFPGGMSKFYTYVGNNFKRPDLDVDKTMRVYVSFVIEKDGSMTDIVVRNDPGYGLGKEAVRVLKSLKTKWTPGMINAKPVRTAYNLPITIKMEAE